MTTLQTAFVIIASVSGSVAPWVAPKGSGRVGLCLSLLGTGIVCLAAAASFK